MLSIHENPPDLPCPPPPQLTSSPLKESKSGGDDERGSSSVEKVDLPRSSPPSKYFSMRDYVFSGRSKNIKTNWPFSQKSLELCLKHGVKDLLPPFATAGNLRRDTLLADKQDTTVLHGEQSRPCDDDSLPSAPHNTPSPANINLSAGTDVNKVSSCSALIDSVPVNRRKRSRSCLELGAKAGRPDKAHPVKKRIFIGAKLSSSSIEENRASNFAVMSESMAAVSKTCPVCKKFSSSSNTTLNAHIDRCLSGESPTIKWTSANSEVSRHRMRPRKTRLMTDIYTTAQHCTLEDLDRRNGTTFAVRPSFSAQEMDRCDDEKTKKLPPVVDTDKACVEGAVYIDANGTKLRILSKFNDGKGTTFGSKKFMKGNRGFKFLSTSKKNKHKSHHSQKKFKKILKSDAQNKVVCSLSRHILEMSGAQDTSYVRKQTTEKEDFPNLQLRSQDYNKMGNEYHEDPYANLSGNSRNLKPPLKANSSEKRHKRLGDEEREVSDDDHSELPYLTKKDGFQMLKCKAAKYLKADDKVLSPCCSSGDTTSGLNQTPHHTNPAVNVNAATPRYGGAHCHHTFSSKAKKFSSPKKNLVPISQTSVVKCSSHKKFKVPCSSRPIIRRDEETCEDDDEKEYDPAAESQGKFQARRHDAKKAKVLRIRKEDKKDEDMSTMGLHPIAGHCGRDIGNNNNNNNNGNNNNSSSTFSVASGLCDDDHLHHVEVEPASSELSAGRKFVKLSKHMGGSGVDENSCLGDDDDHTRLLFGNVEFERKGRYFIRCDKEEMFPTPVDIRATVTQKHEFQGGYCHLEVDSIPIPGPPGSFIPSPGRTCSEEDFQGNSSLVTSNCRPQSSDEDHHPDHELVVANRRGVSSDDSPVSATSTLSHFTRSSDQPDASGKPWLYSTTIEVENQSSSHHHGAENPTPHLEAINVTLLLPKKGFKYSSSEQQQSCCCGFASSQTLSLSYQEPPLPQLLQQQRRTTPLPPTNLHLCHSKVLADSGLPSPSKPVIRLMGKNVLVDSKDDDDESMTPKANPSSQTSFTKEAGKPYHQAGDLQGYHHGWNAGSGLMTMGSILDRCGSYGGGGGYGVITKQAGDVCNQMASMSHSHYAGTGSTTKEVIVIKDSSSSSPNCKNYNSINGMVESRRCPGGNSVPPSTYTTRSMNYADLYGGHTHHRPGWAGVAHAASFRVNGQWNHSSESSDAVNGHHLAPPTPSSTRHLGSSLYCTPGFS